MPFKIGPRIRKQLGEAAHHALAKGYAFVNAGVLFPALPQKELNKLLSAISQMPQEEFANENKIRSRLVTYGYIDPEEEYIRFKKAHSDPSSGRMFHRYNLSDEAQPDAVGIDRKYPAVPSNVENSFAFRRLICLAHEMAPLRQRDGIQKFQVHLMRYEPRENCPSVATPDTFHQDDDWAFAVILLERNNVKGGKNYIGKPWCSNKRLDQVKKEDILAQSELSEILSAYSVNDRIVSHYVDKIECVGENALRTIAIIAFTPMDERVVSTSLPAEFHLPPSDNSHSMAFSLEPSTFECSDFDDSADLYYQLDNEDPKDVIGHLAW